MLRNQINFRVPAGWQPLLEAAAGDDGVSALIRDALRREVKRRTKQQLPGELSRPGRPKKPSR